MLKFDIIESQEELFKNQSIKLIEKEINFLQGMDLPLKDRNKTTFIIAEGWERGIVGGACILKKKLNDIQEDVAELITTLTIYESYVWECSSVYLGGPSQVPIPGTYESLTFLRNFYRGLYEGLVEFGNKNKTGFMIMKLTSEIYIASKEFGLWPYVVELKPHHSQDGLFHGILPLTGSQYQSYQQTWENLDKS
ncbi:MAG: hypothetical protein K2P93_04415 [Alphaproteobacteria bacterium]|nr:hypothetical protein [Alphaproteobacteria bacterium]